MIRVIQIGISNTFKGNMKSVNHVETVAGSGIINDRHFKNNNNQQCQITLIESENIDYFNKESKSSIQHGIKPKVLYCARIGQRFLRNQRTRKQHRIGN